MIELVLCHFEPSSVLYNLSVIILLYLKIKISDYNVLSNIFQYIICGEIITGKYI